MDTYTLRGGAHIGALFGTWPFARITVNPGHVMVRLLFRTVSFTPQQVTRIESLGDGIGIFFRGPHWEESVRFQTFSQREGLLAALERAGFTVIRSAG